MAPGRWGDAGMLAMAGGGVAFAWRACPAWVVWPRGKSAVAVAVAVRKTPIPPPFTHYIATSMHDTFFCLSLYHSSSPHWRRASSPFTHTHTQSLPLSLCRCNQRRRPIHRPTIDPTSTRSRPRSPRPAARSPRTVACSSQLDARAPSAARPCHYCCTLLHWALHASNSVIAQLT